MPTTKLNLYNAALRMCGAARLASLTDESEGRRLLDDVWDDGVVRTCLEKAQWKFALRAQMLDWDPAVTPAFGYARAFAKGSDWITTVGVWSDETNFNPLLHYADEAQYLYADLDTIWVQFVSDHLSFGGDLSTWSASFQDYVAAFMASKIVHRLTSDKERVQLLLGSDGSGVRNGYLAGALKTARSRDAMQGPTRFLPTGSWVRSRLNGTRRGPMGDGGTPGSLIG